MESLLNLTKKNVNIPKKSEWFAFRTLNWEAGFISVGSSRQKKRRNLLCVFTCTVTHRHMSNQAQFIAHKNTNVRPRRLADHFHKTKERVNKNFLASLPPRMIVSTFIIFRHISLVGSFILTSSIIEKQKRRIAPSNLATAAAAATADTNWPTIMLSGGRSVGRYPY